MVARGISWRTMEMVKAIGKYGVVIENFEKSTPQKPLSYIVALLCFAGRKITGERKKYGEKNVTIHEALFIDLVKYFLADIRWDEDRIRFGLQEKNNSFHF